MKTIRTVVLICSLILAGTAKLNSQDTCEVLLIGSSYFNYNNLAGMVKNLADSSDTPLYIEMCGMNGMYLADHASSFTTEAKINERDWDYVVMQGVGVLVAYPDSFPHHPVYPALVTLCDKIYANCSSSRVQFCMPFAFEDGMTWYHNWTDTYEDMQWHIYDTTLQYSNEIGFEISPVGWAWYGVLDSMDYPLHYLHLSDWNHPSERGSYLMACVIYSSVFQQSTVGNSFTAGLPQEEVELFQQTATDTVLLNLDLWNIPAMVSIHEGQGRPDPFGIIQNYPNPFHDITHIRYSTNVRQEICIQIFNAHGTIVETLLDQLHEPGSYSVEFNASGLPAGNYFCRISGSQSRHSIKLIHN